MLAHFKNIFREDRLVHGTLVVTITIGFFLGYIKDHYPSSVNYFLFDIGLAVSLFLWLTSKDRLRRFTLPKTPLTQPLLLFYTVCFVYMCFPDVPFSVSLSAFRGWCVSSLAFLLGYDLMESPRQVKTYLWIVVTLAMVSGIYGVYQYVVGTESAIGQETIIMQRHLGATYVTEEGEVEFRIFSTFVSAAAFGSMMAYASFIALTLAISERVGRLEKFLLMLAIIPMMTSLVLTGTRAALMMMIIGLLILCWYKRRFRIYVTIVALIVVGIYLGIELTEGRAVKRFATLTDPEVLTGRLSAPLVIGLRSLMEAPLGQGLGVTGHGVPFFLMQRYPSFQPIFSDGDFGRVMVEMGIVGFFLLSFILWRAARGAQKSFLKLRAKHRFQEVTALRRIRGARKSFLKLRGTAEEDLGLAIFGSAIMIGIGTLVGSPFLGIPHGMLWWFFLGAIFKLPTLAAERRRIEVSKRSRQYVKVKMVLSH